MIKRLLLVEDNHDLREITLRTLSERFPDFDIHLAANEQEAFQAIQKNCFSVIVTDKNLSDEPGGSTNGGFEILREVRERGLPSQAILLTAYEKPGDQSLFVQKGGFCVVRRVGEYERHLISNINCAQRNFEKLVATSRRNFRIILPGPGEDNIQFQGPRRSVPRKAGRVFKLDLDILRELPAPLFGDNRWNNSYSRLIGRHLWNVVFRDQGILLEWGAARVDNPEHVVIEILGEASALDLPFELIHDGEDFLALSHPLVRIVCESRTPVNDGMDWWPDRDRLRILLIAADTCSRDLPGIWMVDREIQSISEVVGRNGVSIHSCTATAGELLRLLKKQKWDIIHYAGHGHFEASNPSQSGLLFWQEDCDRKSWQDLRHDHRKAVGKRGPIQRLHPSAFCPNGAPPYLVYLSCCYSARAADSRALAFTDSLGLMDALVRSGVRVVLGHRWPLVDSENTVTFVTKFYECLLGSCHSPEQALLRARQALRVSDDPTWSSAVMVKRSA